jgi:osmotically-inducible protein OsmY
VGGGVDEMLEPVDCGSVLREGGIKQSGIHTREKKMANGRGRRGEGGGYDNEYETDDPRYGGPYERGRRPGMGGYQDYGQQRGEQFSGGGYATGSPYGQGEYARPQGAEDWRSGGERFARGLAGGPRRSTPYGSADSFYRGERGGYGYRQGDRDFWDKATDEVSSWFGDREAERRREMDQFRGHGPKGYIRSDERIREDVNDRLTDDGSLDATDIEVDVNDREVTLSGTVNSRFDKRRAEDLAESVSGVTHVQNNIRARQSGQFVPGTATMPVR